MKSVLAAALMCACVFSARAQATIDRITLFNAQIPTEIWMTEPWTTEWILGVSDQPAGPLLNAPDSSISGIAVGDYWLFADPATLGRFPVLTVRLGDGTLLVALFRVVGDNGTAQSWERVAGSPVLSLGWAQGVVDLVGTTNGVHPNGINDLYMQASLGTALAGVANVADVAIVPEPGQAWLLLSGIGLLAAWRRRTGSR